METDITLFDQSLSAGLSDALERLESGLMSADEKIHLCETLGPFRDEETHFMRRCLFLGWFILSTHIDN